MRTLLLLLAFLLTATSALAEERALVTGDTVRMRDKPSLKGTYVGVVYKNMVVTVVEKSAETAIVEGQAYAWNRIRTAAGKEGWIVAKFLDANVPATPIDTYDASGNMEWFYMRFGNSTEYETQELGVDSFSVEEYRNLMKAAVNQDYGACNTLSRTIYRFFAENPTDPKHDYLKARLLSPEYLSSLPSYCASQIVPTLPETILTREFALKLAGAYQSLPERLRGDRDVAIAAIRKDPSAASLVPSALWSDKAVVLEAVKVRGQLLQKAVPALQDDKDVVLAAVGQHFHALQWASARLKKDPAVLAIVSQTRIGR